MDERTRQFGENVIRKTLEREAKRNIVRFDWENDDPENDVMLLKTDSSGEFIHDKVRFVYGYSFTPGAKQGDKRKFLDLVSGRRDTAVLQCDDVRRLVKTGVDRLEQYCRLSDFAAAIRIGSVQSPSLTDEIHNRIVERMGDSCFDLSTKKKACAEVEFDIEKAAAAFRKTCPYYNDGSVESYTGFNQSKFEYYQRSNEYFQIQRFIPKLVREGFSGFLTFQTEDDRSRYEGLRGVSILIYDDLIDSGCTTREMIRYLRTIHDENQFTVFALIKM